LDILNNTTESNLAGNLGRNLKKTPTKQRILSSATHLFAMKGYTETTIREISAFIGMTEASIYNHFPSKNAILEHILEEYSMLISTGFFNQEKLSELKDSPTADEILSCVLLIFPEDKAANYLEKLYVILQEQHRNPIVRKFVSEYIILSTEKVFEVIIDKLIEINVLRPDTNPDYWVKIYSSLIYTFASRMLLGIGDSMPNFSGMGLVELMRSMCNMMLETCGVGKY
jgi:AcrR family transcriptional regulator